MSLTKKKYFYERIAYIMMLVAFFLAWMLDTNALYFSLLMSLQFSLALYLNWEDLRNYKEQSQIHKLWLRFVIIGSVVSFLITLLAIIAVIFGYYQF